MRKYSYPFFFFYGPTLKCLHSIFIDTNKYPKIFVLTDINLSVVTT